MLTTVAMQDGLSGRKLSLTEKIYFADILSVNLNRHSQKRSAVSLIQLKLTIGGGVCGVLLTSTILYLEKMELRAGEKVV